MSAYDYSVCLILPEALREKGNRVSCALGHDSLPGNTYSVELIDGEGARFFGCHTWAAFTFLAILRVAGVPSLQDLEVPENLLAVFEGGEAVGRITPEEYYTGLAGQLVSTPWGDFDLTAMDVADVATSVIVSYRQGASPHEHWGEVLAANGLTSAPQEP